MKMNSMTSFVSGNLMLGEVALRLTAIFIAAGNPKNLIVFNTPYSGNHVVFSRILAIIGALASMLGYAIRK